MPILIVKGRAHAGDDLLYGIRMQEVGINVRRVQIRYFPEVNERFKNSAGETFARSVSQNFSREIAMEGEITGSNGILAFTLGKACTFRTTDVYFYPGYGSFFLDEAVITSERRGWRSVSVRASSSPYI